MREIQRIVLRRLPIVLKKELLRLWRILFAGKYKKIAWYLLGIFYFMKYKSDCRKVRRIAQNTERNRKIIEYISPQVESYHPSFLYPFSLLQIIRGSQTFRKHQCVTYEK